MEQIKTLIQKLVTLQLSSEDFECIIADYWNNRRFLFRDSTSTEIPAFIKSHLHGKQYESYGTDIPGLLFQSYQLFSAPSKPIGIYINAPGEALKTGKIADLNRAPHTHDTGRLTVIIQGTATLYLNQCPGQKNVVIKVPVKEGDCIFWPGHIPHTFDAGDNGFSLLSVMADKETRRSKNYPTPGTNVNLNFDKLPLLDYADYILTETA